LQNDLARAKVAGAGGPGRLFADIGDPVAEHAATALGTRAERFLARKIDGFGIRLVAVLAEIKLGLEVGAQLDDGDERLAHAAAKTLQRADAALGNELFDLGGLQLAT